MQDGIAGPVSHQQQEFLNRIRGSQQHLLGIVNDLLNYGRIEAGGGAHDPAPSPMREVGGGGRSMEAPQADRKRLRLEKGSCSEDVVAMADQLKTEQIVLNLV